MQCLVTVQTRFLPCEALPCFVGGIYNDQLFVLFFILLETKSLKCGMEELFPSMHWKIMLIAFVKFVCCLSTGKDIVCMLPVQFTSLDRELQPGNPRSTLTCSTDQLKKGSSIKIKKIGKNVYAIAWAFKRVHGWCMLITLGSVGLTDCKSVWLKSVWLKQNKKWFTSQTFIFPYFLPCHFLCWMYMDVNDVALYCNLRNSQNVTANFTFGRWALF